MVADLLQTVRALETLLKALNGEQVDQKLLSDAENVLFENEVAEQNSIRDALELKAYVTELKMAELLEKVENTILVGNIVRRGIKIEQLGDINDRLGRFNASTHNTFTDFELFQIAREVDKAKLDYSGHENIENLHCHYITVLAALDIEANKVTEEDINNCSTKMSDFKPQSPTTLPRSAEKLRSEAEEQAITH